MQTRRPVILLLYFVLWPGVAWAWGPTGHRTVGRIAERHLSAAAKQEVQALLGHGSLARVATWADEVRSDPDWAKASTWHWVTIPNGQTYADTEKNPTGDLIEAIGRFSAQLADRTKGAKERAVALKFLTHFIGDLHQPLHVGRGDDRGGNEIVVFWHGEPSNLHAVWDSGMINKDGLSFSELASFVDHADPGQVTAWQNSDVIDWARESKSVRGRVYDIGDRRLGYRYSYFNRSLLERRLLRAGVRLAGLLNRLLAPPTDGNDGK